MRGNEEVLQMKKSYAKMTLMRKPPARPQTKKTTAPVAAKTGRLGKPQATVFVCRGCDRLPAKQDGEDAEGAGFYRELKKLLAPLPVQVRASGCMGGCDCGDGLAENGCCTVGIGAKGKFGYVLNKFDPAVDGWKVVELVKLYLVGKRGRIKSKEHVRASEIRPHVATKLPPL